MTMENKAEEKLKYIAESIGRREREDMNRLLAPEFVSCDAEKRMTRIRFRAQQWETNQRGEIHGGAISAMFDTSMGMSVLAFSDSGNIATTDLNVSFIKPFLGDSFLFETEITHPGRLITRVRALAYDEETGKCLASAAASFVAVSG